MPVASRVLTVSDLDPLGTTAALVGFVGFTLSLWALVWLGWDAKGHLRSRFGWWVVALVVSYLVMLWGLMKA